MDSLQAIAVSSMSFEGVGMSVSTEIIQEWIS
jgi:hypothetical protein